jgi:protein phosphatase 1G
VAEYCSQHLPQFVKDLDSYKAGNYEQALKEAFIGFDATLLEAKVVEELRQMARKNPDYEDSDMDEDDETAEEIINLHEEATMPLTEVLEKYKGNVDALDKIQKVQRLMGFVPQQGEAEASGGPSSSAGGSSGSAARPSGSGTSPKKSASDNEVSSSSCKPVSEADTAEPSSSSGAVPVETPDSTHTIPKATEGASSGSKPEQSTTESSEVSVEQASANGAIDDEGISSSSAQENGESASSCPSSSSSQPLNYSMGGSSSVSGSSPSKAAPKVPNHITSSSLPDTEVETESSSDDENDKTYKESQGPKPVNSDGDTTEEDDVDDDDELDEEEEVSGEDEEEEDSFDDEFMNNMETGPGKASGCTAVVALLSGRDLYVANAGDSRCVVCRDGKVVEMSFDHKPEDDIELSRIRKAGGRVTLDGRVNGGLNLSRAIGDHGYKANTELTAEEQMISALPDLKRITINPTDEFLVLACDGIWNYMTNEEVIGFVKQRIDNGKLSLAEICEEVSNHEDERWFKCSNFLFSLLAFPQLLGTKHNGRRNRLRQHDGHYRQVQTGIACSSRTTAPRVGSRVAKVGTQAFVRRRRG